MASDLKIAIVGSSPKCLGLTPFHDPDIQIWSMNDLYLGNPHLAKSCDRWFQVHPLDTLHFFDPIIGVQTTDVGEHKKWLEANQYKLDILVPSELLPRARVIPARELFAMFGGTFFFNGTLPWMMAVAIHEGVKEIGLYGCDLAMGEEFERQRSGFFFFKHEAERRGIKIIVPPESDLASISLPYPFEHQSLPAMRARQRDLEARRKDHEKTAKSLEHEITFRNGRIKELDHDNEDDKTLIDELHEQRIDMARVVSEHEKAVATLTGAIDEIDHTINNYLNQCHEPKIPSPLLSAMKAEPLSSSDRTKRHRGLCQSAATAAFKRCCRSKLRVVEVPFRSRFRPSSRLHG